MPHTFHRDLKKYIDAGRSEKLFLVFTMTDKSYGAVKSFEELYFSPIDDHRHEFGLILFNDIVAFLNPHETHGVSREDRTITTLIFDVCRSVPPEKRTVLMEVGKEYKNDVNALVAANPGMFEAV